MKRILALLCMLLCMTCLVPIPPSGMPRHIGYTKVEPPTYVAHEVSVYIDKNFGAEDQLMLDDAINAWNYALNGTLKLVVKSTTFDMDMDVIREVFRGSGGFIIIPVNSKDCAFLPLAASPDMVNLAWADLTNHHDIYVVRDRVGPASNIKPIMLHEIGHILGAQHIQGYGLMNPTFNAQEYACIDENTIHQISEYNHIPVEFLNFCFDN